MTLRLLAVLAFALFASGCRPGRVVVITLEPANASDMAAQRQLVSETLASVGREMNLVVGPAEQHLVDAPVRIEARPASHRADDFFVLVLIDRRIRIVCRAPTPAAAPLADLARQHFVQALNARHLAYNVDQTTFSSD